MSSTLPSTTIRTAACLVLLAAAVPAAWAQTTALTVEQFEENSGLRILDLATGELTPIGPIELPPGLFGPREITFLPSGELVGVSRFCETLVRIDPATAETTVVGDLGIGPPTPALVFGLAADACGRLWMACGGTFDISLYEVDSATGQATLVGPLPVPIQGLAAGGGLLYGFDFNFFNDSHLLSLDPATLEMTEIAEVEGLWSWSATSADLDAAGELVTLGKVIPPPPAIVPQEVIHVSLSGEIVLPRVEVLGPLGSFGGLALGPPTGECVGGALAIPAASDGGLVFLAVLIAAAGAILVWRRG